MPCLQNRASSSTASVGTNFRFPTLRRRYWFVSFQGMEYRGASGRRSMSNPVDRDLGPLLCAPKSVRNVQRVQEVIKEIQEFIEPEFRRPAPTAPVDGGVPRSLEPTLIPEFMSVPRRRSHLGMLVCFLLGVAALSTPSKFPIEGIATAE